MKQSNTTLMRVPIRFKRQIEFMRDKWGHKSNIEFLDKDAMPLLQNSDFITSVFRKPLIKKK